MDKTAAEVLQIAAKEIGYKESPAGSNRTKYGAWYGLDGQPWCVIFVQWCLRQAGADFYKTASCTALMNYAKKHGMWVERDFLPGDIVIYTFNARRTPEHCGFFEGADTYGYVHSIDGNTGDYSAANGGQVMRKTRDKAYVLGAVRPPYNAAQGAQSAAALRCRADLPLLSGGERTEAVRALQTLLMLRCISVGSCGVDGIFGADTKKAVLSFQAASGLEADGIVGENTWAKLIGG